MHSVDETRPYPAWRLAAGERQEDAAHVFGYYLIRHCRDAALASAGKISEEARSAAEQAVDAALHNVCDLLEGFWPLPIGPEHRAELVLGVRVRDARGEVKETVEISPCKVDLPIGYWVWARDRRFQ